MKRVYAICDDDYHARVKAHAKARGLKMQDWLISVVDDAMQERKGPEDGVPADLRPLIRKLAEILSSGDTDAIAAIKLNVEHFRNRLRPVSKR